MNKKIVNRILAARLAQLSLCLILAFSHSFSWAYAPSRSIQDPSPEIQHLDNLPPELTQVILDQLNPSDLANLSAVSKEFQQVTEFHWKKFCKILLRLSANDSDEMTLFQQEFDNVSRSYIGQDKWKWKDLFVLLVKLQITQRDFDKELAQTNVLAHKPRIERARFHSRAQLAKVITLSLKTFPETLKRNFDTATFGDLAVLCATGSVALITWAATQDIPYEYLVLGTCVAAIKGATLGSLAIHHFFDPALTQFTSTLIELDQQEIIQSFKAATVEEYRNRFGFVPAFVSKLAERQ
jgi:hypothetical protein